MRTFDSRESDFLPSGPVAVARWEQYRIQTELPFGAMWYTVPPGSSSEPDCHPEPELSIVLTGDGVVEAGGRLIEVSAGTAFLLDSNERHVVHNRTATQPLTIFSAYWMPPEVGPVEPITELASANDRRPSVVEVSGV